MRVELRDKGEALTLGVAALLRRLAGDFDLGEGEADGESCGDRSELMSMSKEATVEVSVSWIRYLKLQSCG